ncbi:hypothetical protein L226DRAFT_573138 [Lentinus tigrinus ALCF2SS1-7]|uniref:uncharacterized protein n=1 Tax=Lentinus tigrinus ALCF2SS1-7 TaxID=1328758 RepID=UPI001165EB7C|nr:hypothetical protein L226DRAFT_573138 [Lentinus tigrinus ALCF2SS1-7]
MSYNPRDRSYPALASRGETPSPLCPPVGAADRGGANLSDDLFSATRSSPQPDLAANFTGAMATTAAVRDTVAADITNRDDVLFSSQMSDSSVGPSDGSIPIRLCAQSGIEFDPVPTGPNPAAPEVCEDPSKESSTTVGPTMADKSPSFLAGIFVGAALSATMLVVIYVMSDGFAAVVSFYRITPVIGRLALYFAVCALRLVNRLLRYLSPIAAVMYRTFQEWGQPSQACAGACSPTKFTISRHHHDLDARNLPHARSTHPPFPSAPTKLDIYPTLSVTFDSVIPSAEARCIFHGR